MSAPPSRREVITMAASHQQRYRQRRLGQAHGKTRQEVVTLALLAAERLLNGD